MTIVEMMKKIFSALVKQWLPLIPLLGVFSFSSLDLSQDNRLIFSLDSNKTDFRDSYSTLILNQLDQNQQEMLTFYPERIYSPDNGNQFYLHNRLGLFHGNMAEGTMKVQNFYSHFQVDSPPELGHLDPLSLSPDGDFVIFFRQQNLVMGDLVLYDLEHNEEYVITEDFEPVYQDQLVKWSPDSRFFCYSKAGNIYYFSIAQYLEGRDLVESAHLIGKGSINSFNWSRDNSLYYIDGRNIYHIHSTEIFALSFYDTPLQIGTVAGRLFVNFDKNHDGFWLSPDGDSVLIRKGEGNVFLYDLEFRDYNLNSQVKALPFVKLPVGSTIKKILWSREGKICILAENRLNQNEGTLIFVYDPAEDKEKIISLDQSGVKDIELSPDESYISLVYDDHISIRNYQQWNIVTEFPIKGVLHHFWKDNRELYLFGEKWTGTWDYLTENTRRVFLSQADRFGFSSDEKILIESDGLTFTYNSENKKIQESRADYIRERRLNSPSYRIFKEHCSGIYFDEMVMLRKIDGYGTTPLLDDFTTDLEDYPMEDDLINQFDGYFVHGSRVRNREVAMVFDITSEDEGLMDILSTLSDYGIRATFFVNGDFIRKYPGALRILVKEGHEIGSMFYTNLDMSDRSYAIDKDFIIRGLARNEDEFYKASGQEVSTLWHAPWYIMNSMIVEAGQDINYTYISRDIDSLDWVGVEDEGLYADSSTLVQRIMEMKKPGSIISMNVGVEVKRNDYLYQKLDLIINGLLKQGYEIVDVSSIMENAR